MTASRPDDESVFVRYRLHFGLGVLLALALSIMILRVGISEEPEKPEQATERVAPPPMPTTEVEVIENEVIEQSEIQFDASLQMGTVKTSSRK